MQNRLSASGGSFSVSKIYSSTCCVFKVMPFNSKENTHFLSLFFVKVRVKSHLLFDSISSQ